MSATKTINPLHFEDLEPHRFESLVRQLIYSFKDWADLEATGGMGSDDGYDIRGWEKIKDVVDVEDDSDDEEIVSKKITKTNLWMVQCKRVAKIGPTEIKNIVDDALKDLKKDQIPFGYMIIASAGFSKKSHDTFREKMKEYGVQEYYLWGKDKLEDLLFMPINDQLLFAYFGISISVKRRKTVSDIRYKVGVKNKLFKVLNGSSTNYQINEKILLRDINDEKYPYKKEYKDFELNPRWREYVVSEFHPNGIIVKINQNYGYYDKVKKQFDFYKTIDLLHRDSEMNDQEKREKESKLFTKILDIWDFLPTENKGKFIKYGFILYKDIIAIDPEGDSFSPMPHLFVEFKDKTGPFKAIFGTMTPDDNDNNEINLDIYKRIKYFPKVLPIPKKFKEYTDKSIFLNIQQMEQIKGYRRSILYLPYKDFNFLKVRDKIRVSIKNNITVEDYPLKIQVLRKKVIPFNSIPFNRFGLERYESLEEMKKNYEDLYDRKIKNTDKYIVLEFRQTY